MDTVGGSIDAQRRKMENGLSLRPKEIVALKEVVGEVSSTRSKNGRAK